MISVKRDTLVTFKVPIMRCCLSSGHFPEICWWWITGPLLRCPWIAALHTSQIWQASVISARRRGSCRSAGTSLSCGECRSSSICVFACVDACVWVCVSVCAWVSVGVGAGARMCAWTCVDACVCVCVGVCVSVCACVTLSMHTFYCCILSIFATKLVSEAPLDVSMITTDLSINLCNVKKGRYMRILHIRKDYKAFC